MISNIIELFLTMIVRAFFIPLSRIQEAVLWLGLVRTACIGAAPFALLYYSSGCGQSVAAQESASRRRTGKALVRGLYLDAPSYEDACTHQREIRNMNIVGGTAGAYSVSDDTEISNVPGPGVIQAEVDERAKSNAANEAEVGMMPPILEGDFTLGLVLLAPVGTPEIAQ